MKEFKGGVKWYTKSTVTIGFPEDDVCCYRCPLMGVEFTQGHRREHCRRTGEYLPAPLDTIGVYCPLEFEETNNTHIK